MNSEQYCLMEANKAWLFGLPWDDIQIWQIF